MFDGILAHFELLTAPQKDKSALNAPGAAASTFDKLSSRQMECNSAGKFSVETNPSQWKLFDIANRRSPNL